MKKIDKLILGAYLGPFVITFLVVVFILLNIQMLKYFDDIFGKGLDWLTVGQLFFYFAVYTTPSALPLAVLLSSLITYGNLGEHFELTAIKSAGISLIRTLRPIFIFILILTVFAFYFNNNFQPKAALEAYSLLYDIKQKKPAMDLREGIFYYGIPDISIKVNKKFPDGVTLKDIIIYDHRGKEGNKDVTIADSGKMYTILNERYLKFELFNGVKYEEGLSGESDMVGQKKNQKNETLSRMKFQSSKVVFDLASFTTFERTDKKWFQGNRIMRNLGELEVDIDSIENEILRQRLELYQGRASYFNYYAKKDSLVLPPEVNKYKLKRDSLSRSRYMASQEKEKREALLNNNKKELEVSVKDTTDTFVNADKVTKPVVPKRKSSVLKKIATQKMETLARHDSIQKAHPEEPTRKDTFDLVAHQHLIDRRIDSLVDMPLRADFVQNAANQARQIKNQIANSNAGFKAYHDDYIIFLIQWHKIIASSLMCVVMFLIGAPLGAIIKRGGLGVPFLVSILFFIIYYVLTIQGEKFAKQGAIGVITGVWMPDVILLTVGMLFLRQARVDGRLFDADSYLVAFDKFKRWLKSFKKTAKPIPAAS